MRILIPSFERHEIHVEKQWKRKKKRAKLLPRNMLFLNFQVEFSHVFRKTLKL